MHLNNNLNESIFWHVCLARTTTEWILLFQHIINDNNIIYLFGSWIHRAHIVGSFIWELFSAVILLLFLLCWFFFVLFLFFGRLHDPEWLAIVHWFTMAILIVTNQIHYAKTHIKLLLAAFERNKLQLVCRR